MSADAPVEGRNGVAIRTRADSDKAGFRTYEVYQRERVGESTEKIKPRQLISEQYRTDPYPVLSILREHYPCYRDWLGNQFWISGYNDVTSIFRDDANFETRPKTWFYGIEGYGRDLNAEIYVQQIVERVVDASVEQIAGELTQELKGGGNLAVRFAAALPLRLLGKILALPEAQFEPFASALWRAERGVSWRADLAADGRKALDELEALFSPLFEARRKDPGDDLVSAIAGDPNASVRDLVSTVLERDHQTLHGALANLWRQLLVDPEAREQATATPRLMKTAYLETLRHTPPVLSAKRFARHEVERFGRLLPEGALMLCSAGAANRDPRVFSDPDRFVVDRKDLCQREPRGQYRADGLATGIAFGLGPPSIHPAVPEDRPRSLYAITRDAAVAASMVLARELPNLRLAGGAAPELSALSVGEMHTCWQLPVLA